MIAVLSPAGGSLRKTANRSWLHRTGIPCFRLYGKGSRRIKEQQVKAKNKERSMVEKDQAAISQRYGRWMKKAKVAKDASRPKIEPVKEKLLLKSWIVPYRYRYPEGNVYTAEQAKILAYRLPMFLALAGLLLCEDTTPFSFITIHGPSMLPTMAADSSDIWLRRTWNFTKIIGYWPIPYKTGDIVGFAHPSYPDMVSCKRVVGVAGDSVKRYGQYVHLYIHQDPSNWGIIYPELNEPQHKWIDRNWEGTTEPRDAERTLIVPEGHVWVEADCPGFGIDSRHFGPIPIEWLQGTLVGQIVPLKRKQWKQRPHPISLDKETLMEHNIFQL